MRLAYQTSFMYCVSGYTITQLSWLMYSGNKRWGNLVSYPGPPPLAVHKTAPESKGNEKHEECILQLVWVEEWVWLLVTCYIVTSVGVVGFGSVCQLTRNCFCWMKNLGFSAWGRWTEVPHLVGVRKSVNEGWSLSLSLSLSHTHTHTHTTHPRVHVSAPPHH